MNPELRHETHPDCLGDPVLVPRHVERGGGFRPISLCRRGVARGIVAGFYPNDRIQTGSEGIEIKSTRKKGGAVDTHGARDQWMCVFVYEVDTETEPARDRRPMSFTEVYLAHVGIDDFRSNARGELGTRTATLHRDGVRKLREHWVYKA